MSQKNEIYGKTKNIFTESLRSRHVDGQRLIFPLPGTRALCGFSFLITKTRMGEKYDMGNEKLEIRMGEKYDMYYMNKYCISFSVMKLMKSKIYKLHQLCVLLISYLKFQDGIINRNLCLPISF